MMKNAVKNDTPLTTSGDSTPTALQQRLENVRERRFTDPAQAQGGEGDTQLARRQVGIELTVHGAQDVPAPAVVVQRWPRPGSSAV